MSKKLRMPAPSLKVPPIPLLPIPGTEWKGKLPEHVKAAYTTLELEPCVWCGGIGHTGIMMQLCDWCLGTGRVTR